MHFMGYNQLMRELHKPLTKKELSKIHETLPERLDYLMRLHALTKKALAEILCCSESAISGYRTGRRTPDYLIICNLCTVLGVTPDYLLGFIDEICPTHN